MSQLPLPVRVAVGLAVTAVEQACKFPEQLADLPVTAASRAVQAGMRVQQRVTELAIKGDQVFSLLQPVEDTPPWARFDEDEEPHHTSAGDADVARVLATPPDDAAGAPGSNPPRSTLLAEYDKLSLAQLRGKLRTLSLPELSVLLAHERAHQDRPAYLTLLSNRISTVRSR
ncbi:MAG: lipid droplet-associated protein [Pseudonocardiaceae bacterium]